MNEGLVVSTEESGEAGTAPSAAVRVPEFVNFDLDFYVATYSDIGPAGVDPERHFRDHGFSEGRFGTPEELAEAVDLVRASGHFDAAWYRKTFDVGSRTIEDYLVKEVDLRRAPNPTFDRRFFLLHYPRTMRPRERAFVTFCRYASHQWCRDSLAAFEAEAEALAASPLFDETFFREACGDLDRAADAATYYLTEGFRRGLNPSKRFNTRSYKALYPDIARADLNPLLHFIRHGEAEGRVGFGEDTVWRKTGSFDLLPGRPTVLVVNHEGSLSGAPVVGLNLARCLGGSYNVVSVLLRGGLLTEEFAKASHEVVVVGDSLAHMANGLDVLAKDFDIACAVLNSVECTKMLPMLVEREIPTVSLIHEFAQYVYPFDLFARALALTDIAVFPSKLVESHARQELRARGVPDGELSHVRIRPQGRPLVPVVEKGNIINPALARKRLEREIARRSTQGRPFVVLGAGWVQPRKGVDLFIEVARLLVKEMRVHALFVWVGPNYNPRSDMLVSVYLADQITKSGLDDDILFFDEQPDLRPFYEKADAFLMSSRLDPYPNVAVEAIAEGKHLVCFEGATGIADLALWPDAVTAVPYGDLRAAAAKLAELHSNRANTGSPKHPLPADLQQKLSFDDYARDIAAAIEEARERLRTRRVAARDLLEGGGFDHRLFARSLPAWILRDDEGGKTAETLAGLAAVLLANAMPIGLVRSDRSTSAAAGTTGWSAANITSLDPGAVGAEHSLDYRAHIVLAESRDEIALVADLIFATPSLKAIMIVSETLRPDDLRVVERVLGTATLTIIAPGEATIGDGVAAFLEAAGPDSLVGVTFRISSHTPADLRQYRAFHHACDAKLPADFFLLSALALDPDPSFLLDDKSSDDSPAQAKNLAIAHRLVDCRRLWLRPTAMAQAAQAQLVGSLARLGADLRSSDVWQALAGPEGLLATSRWVYISPTVRCEDDASTIVP